MPIYTTIGGLALLLFWDEGTPISAVPGETYRMSTSPMLPAIPLFTLAGYILAAGGSSRRLLRLCSALVGWMPGGLAIVITLVLAFFTPLTGASGITILAMGGLLLPMLLEARYSERHAVGLVTVSGSIGVLFPPSLPVILYAYYAKLSLDRLFIAGLLPGIVLVAVVAAWGAWRGWLGGATRTPFQGRELGSALWAAKWEILLPIVVLTSLFGGFATLVEAAALTVLYALVVECLVCRELRVARDLVHVAIESATMVGGFMIILGVALGLTNYLIIAQIPMQALEWVQEFIHSPYLFLLALNVLLIMVGALMDIYSAIIVIVPLIAPMAAAYDLDPVHLGIIFLANMQLGYLTPPMGENLFLSAYRFNQPLARIYRSTLPYVVILLLAVLLITYVPPITLWLLGVFGV
jgi:tripartite ATP-independent transporter DctM subunit